MDLGDVADELLDDYRLADARSPVGADLAALGERRDEVERLDAGFEHFGGHALVFVGRRRPVDGPMLLGVYRAEVVERRAHDVEQPSKTRLAHGHRDGLAHIPRGRAARQALGRAQSEAPDPAVPDLLLHLEHQALAGDIEFQRVEDSRELVRGEFHVHDGPDDLYDFALGSFGHCASPIQS